MITHRKVKEKLETLNELLHTEYQTDFCSHYGGWNLYLVDKPLGGHRRGKYGFDYRKSTKEFYQYLCGIINALTA